ncbi:MAG: hypothetical protein WC809_20555 [Sinimarinibacterium sp.]|jgi:hypothetical protein
MAAPDISYLLIPVVVLFSMLLGATLFAVAFAPDAGARILGRDAKTGIRRELGSLRLGRMLQLRGVGLADFVDRHSARELQQAAADCRECHNAARCEAVLRGFLPGGDYAFCASDAAITRAARVAGEAPARPG